MDDEIARYNSEFWNEMCGSNQAKVLGITDLSPESLKKFDDWYFDFYPYLVREISPLLKKDLRVLEVGLGFGSLTTLALHHGVKYQGIDIADGPVNLANLRGNLAGQSVAVASLADVRALTSIASATFDGCMAIGSLHHTGDFDRAIRELHRVTKRGGNIHGMVYSLFSLRNWLFRPVFMSRCLVKNIRGNGVRIQADEKLRWMSDHNSEGKAAPSTEYFSRKALRSVLDQFGSVKVRARNLDDIPLVSSVFPGVRKALIRLGLDRLLGLDLYFTIDLSRASSQPETH